MMLSEKYRDFVIEYEQRLEDYKNSADEHGDQAAKAVASIFKKLAHKMYPLNIKEWLNKELGEAIEREDFEYAKEVKQELENICL
jgi:protein-arginine kinase activator protein McsA